MVQSCLLAMAIIIRQLIKKYKPACSIAFHYNSVKRTAANNSVGGIEKLNVKV